jgi:hypothetical protein
VRVSSTRRDVPFHVLAVESTDADLAPTFVARDDGAYEVSVRYSGAPERHVNALLKIKTDEPSQPLLLVRVSGRP